MHDRAAAHDAISVRYFVHETFPGRRIGRRGSIDPNVPMVQDLAIGNNLVTSKEERVP